MQTVIAAKGQADSARKGIMTTSGWTPFSRESPKVGQDILMLYSNGDVLHVKSGGCVSGTHWQPFIPPGPEDEFAKFWEDNGEKMIAGPFAFRDIAKAAWTEATRQAEEKK
jgi:hypothetical protein